MPDPVLRTVDLTKVYADFWGRPRVAALEGLTLEVRQGEVFGLLGPNGSGKTTTIKLLLGLLRATRGDAFVFGRDPSDQAVKHRLGYLPEETYLYQFLNAEETLAFFGSLFRMPAAVLKRRSDELIGMVGLGHARKRRLGEYSKGMARRLGLAQALINDPDLVILDEPTSGLDPLAHYMAFGWREGRNPSSRFDAQWYIDTYRDIGEAALNPLVHYIIHGASEGREIKAVFTPE